MSVQQFNSFSQKFIFFIFRFIGLPLFLWAFLSLPALYYAAYFSKLWKVFDNAYVNLNFNFVFVILGVFAPVYYFFNKSSRIVFPLILLLLFLIRFFDVGLKSTFQISFSPIVFRSTSIDSFFIALDLFGKELTLVVLVGILCGIVISYLMGMGFRKTRTSLITLAIFLLLSVRSSYILYNEDRKSVV